MRGLRKNMIYSGTNAKNFTGQGSRKQHFVLIFVTDKAEAKTFDFATEIFTFNKNVLSHTFCKKIVVLCFFNQLLLSNAH